MYRERDRDTATKTVLVVDDAPGIVYVIQEALEGSGYRVVTAVGLETLKVAFDLRPDAILLDLMMPGMDGVELCHSLRQDVRTKKIPIMVISAAANLRTHADDLQVVDFLAKPFDLTELLLRVEKLTA